MAGKGIKVSDEDKKLTDELVDKLTNFLNSWIYKPSVQKRALLRMYNSMRGKK